MKQLADTLKHFIAQLADGGLCVAFSGGVDSALLLKLCCEVSSNVHAVTFDTMLHPKADTENAIRLAHEYGAKHTILTIDEFSDEQIMENPVNRCYLCKHLLFETLTEYAKKQGLQYILDGTNADDLLEYRPGLKALEELHIISPLAKLGITKAQVRQMAAMLGLEVATKPSSPCLATRLPYHVKITKEALEQIRLGEDFLRRTGFEIVRIRLHKDIARIEVPLARLEELLAKRSEITAQLKAIGFTYITVDLEGFRSGSMDIHIHEKEQSK